MRLIALNFRIVIEDDLETEDFDEIGQFLAEDIEKSFQNGVDNLSVEYMGCDIFENP